MTINLPMPIKFAMPIKSRLISMRRTLALAGCIASTYLFKVNNKSTRKNEEYVLC